MSNQGKPLQLIPTLALNGMRSSVAILESVRGRRVLWRVLGVIESSLSESFGEQVRVTRLRTHSMKHEMARKYSALGLRLFGSKVALYFLDGSENEIDRIQSWIEDSLPQEAILSQVPLEVLSNDQSREAHHSKGSLVGIRFDLNCGDTGVLTIFANLDQNLIRRIAVYARQESLPVCRAPMLRHLLCSLSLELVFELNSLSVLLAAKRGGEITLFDKTSRVGAWRIAGLAGVTTGEPLLNVKPVAFDASRRSLLFRVAPNKIGRREEMNQKSNTCNFPLADLGVCLSVELGKTRLSLADLIDLAPGASLEFELPVNGKVMLQAGEEQIAEAQLVSEADRLLLQVTQVFEEGEKNNETDKQKMRLLPTKEKTIGPETESENDLSGMVSGSSNDSISTLSSS